MRILIRCAVVACATFFTSKAASAQSANDRLRDDLDSLFSNTAFSNATFGVAIQSLKTGEYLYRRNDTKSLMPASNMKLFTTAEALALLGPDYHYETTLETFGTTIGHTLSGNLILRGVGDPTFGARSPYFDSPNGEVFPAWADSLRAKGIRRIEGTIAMDNSFFTGERYPDGWQLDDAPYYYATPITALSYNENQVSLDVAPATREGAPARVMYSEGQPRFGVVHNHAVTGAPSAPVTIDAERLLCSDTIRVTGTIPSFHPTVTEQTSVEYPEGYAAWSFRMALKKAGIRVSGKFRRLARSSKHPRVKMLASYLSPPVSAILRAMNKESDNLFAEMLFRTVAKVIGGEGSWTRGITVMRKYLASIGIDTTCIQFTDGSGLSRMDLVTADDILTVLRAMHSNPKLDSVFYNSLPVMGVDGTLENRMKGTPAQGNVHAKTGSMTGVRSISGYLTTRDGEPIAFSILANNYTVPGSEIGKLEDEVLLRLVNFSRR